MIRHAIERPVSTLIGAVTLVVLGTFSLLRLPVSLLPELERPRLEISHRRRGPGPRGGSRPADPARGAPARRPGRRDLGAHLDRRRRPPRPGGERVADRRRPPAHRGRAPARRPGRSGCGSMSIELATGDAGADRGGGGARRSLRRGAHGLRPQAPGARAGAARRRRPDRDGRASTPLHAVVRPRAAALAARGLTPADLVGAPPLRGRRPARRPRPRRGGRAPASWCGRRSARCDALRALRSGLEARASSATWPGWGWRRSRTAPSSAWTARRGCWCGSSARRRRTPWPWPGACGSGSGSWRERTGSGPRPQVVADRSGEVVAALQELGLAALIGIGSGRGRAAGDARPLASDPGDDGRGARPRCSPPSPASTSRAPRWTWSRSPAWPSPPACWWTAPSWSWSRSRRPAPPGAPSPAVTGTQGDRPAGDRELPDHRPWSSSP